MADLSLSSVIEEIEKRGNERTKKAIYPKGLRSLYSVIRLYH